MNTFIRNQTSNTNQIIRSNMRHGIPKKFNEYTIFLLLEEERALRLKEVDEKSHTKDMPSQIVANEVVGSVKLPPRYRDLDLSIEWFISRLDGPVNDSEASAQKWKQLDRATLTYLGYLTTKLRLEYLELRRPRNQFEGFVREAQRNSVPLLASCTGTCTSSKHVKSPIKPKQDLGAWFDNWFKNGTDDNSSPASQPHQESQDDLGTCFERLFRSPGVASLQNEMLSGAGASNNESRFQEVDMSDKEIVELWLAHRA